MSEYRYSCMLVDQEGFYELVLATIWGFPDAVRVWNRTGWSRPGCYPEYMGTCEVRRRVRTGPQLDFTVPITVSPIKYLNSHHIATRSIREMCRLMPDIMSHSQICDRINVC
jgi:hypothetical protein